MTPQQINSSLLLDLPSFLLFYLKHHIHQAKAGPAALKYWATQDFFIMHLLHGWDKYKRNYEMSYRSAMVNFLTSFGPFWMILKPLELYQTIFSSWSILVYLNLSPSMLVSICLSLFISVYLGLSRSTLVYLGLSWSISVYLGLSWTISDNLGLSLTISDYLRLYKTISDYLGISQTILHYFRLYQIISDSIRLSDYL